MVSVQYITVTENLRTSFDTRIMNENLRNLNRIECIVTMACTGRCRHCSEGSHESFKDHLDGSAVENAIMQICKQYKIDSLMVFGGEPLLYPDDVCRIFRAGLDAGIPQREMITNGFFSKDEKRIEEVADMLAKSGVNYIMLSADSFHQETIPLEPVYYFAKCIRSMGINIEINPAWLVSEEDNNPYNVKTREILKVFQDDGFMLANGNVIWPEGNARIYLSEYFDLSVPYENPYDDDPADIRALSFEPDGTVLNMNFYDKNIIDILEGYKP